MLNILISFLPGYNGFDLGYRCTNQSRELATFSSFRRCDHNGQARIRRLPQVGGSARVYEVEGRYS